VIPAVLRISSRRSNILDWAVENQEESSSQFRTFQGRARVPKLLFIFKSLLFGYADYCWCVDFKRIVGFRRIDLDSSQKKCQILVLNLANRERS